jgi:hypothetical protein
VGSPRTPSRWTYRGGKPARSRRVVKTRDAEERSGVRHQEDIDAEKFHITPRQARWGLGIAVWVVAMWGGWQLYHSPYLSVSSIEVTGTSSLSAEDVAAAANIEGDSIFGLDLAQAETRVEALREVRDATIEKRGWTGVTIHVEERTAWGNWQIDGVNLPVDADGYILEGAPAPEGSPLIMEIEAQRQVNRGDRIDWDAIALAQRLLDESQRSFGRQVLAMIYRHDAGLTVVLSGQDIEGKAVWVTFGDSRDYDYKIAALYNLLEQAKEQHLALNAVDLRFGDRLSFN